MTETDGFHERTEAASLIDPASLHILIVDATNSSRQHISSLLRECSYQVTACKTSHEAIQILKAQQGPNGNAGFDLILKEHSPAAGTNACRLLRRAQREPVLKGIPIIVASTQEDRDVMVSCLQLGAADYLLKPLRHNELRNLWARVYWWRRAFYLQQHASVGFPVRDEQFHASMLNSSSGASDETKCDDEEQQNELAVGDAERSGEGSAPNGSNGIGDSRENGSRANGSKNGSKFGVNCSRTQATGANGNGNSGANGIGNSGANGDGNGNSATKANQGSNHPSGGAAPWNVNGYSGVGPNMARQESAALAGTAEGVYAALSTQAIDALADAQATAAAGNAPREASRQPSNTTDVRATVELPEPTPLDISIQQPRLVVNPPGFRAYINKDTARKRSGELIVKNEEDAGNSSGSGRTTSQEGAKRRPISKLGNPSGHAPVSEAAASDATVLLNRAASGPVQPLFAGRSMGANASSNGNGANSAWSGGQGQQMQAPYYSNYPFGMVPPFGIPPQYWQQMSGSGNAPSITDVQQGMQQQQLGMQQQQLAMHNQLMYQHSFMMQQFGMPSGGMPSFAPMMQSAQSGGKAPEQMQSSGGVPPSAPMAIRPGQSGSVHQVAKGSGLQRLGSTGNALQRLGSNARQMLPPPSDLTSGLATGMGTATNTATGNTLGTASKGGNTGATSNSTAPVINADGSLVEPSLKERRARALHKYKQKRKNLCFTKKIRYESRKQLAQARPRVRGQFVRVRADDVGAVAEAMAIAAEHGTISGDAVVPQLALQKASGNQEVAAELMVAAEQLVNPPTVENTEEEDFDEEDYGEEDDVNSPAEHPVGPGGTKSAFANPANVMRAPGKALLHADNAIGRHSSDSGSNSPDIKEQAARS